MFPRARVRGNEWPQPATRGYVSDSIDIVPSGQSAFLDPQQAKRPRIDDSFNLATMNVVASAPLQDLSQNALLQSSLLNTSFAAALPTTPLTSSMSSNMTLTLPGAYQQQYNAFAPMQRNGNMHNRSDSAGMREMAHLRNELYEVRQHIQAIMQRFNSLSERLGALENQKTLGLERTDSDNDHSQDEKE